MKALGNDVCTEKEWGATGRKSHDVLPVAPSFSKHYLDAAWKASFASSELPSLTDCSDCCCDN